MSNVVFVIALMAVLLAMNVQLPKFRDGYRCPGCGSKRPDGHDEDCFWRKPGA